MEKRCFKCLCVKPLAEFYKHSRMADGRLNKCKDCTKRDVTEHRIANLERVRAYDKRRASMPHRIAARKDYQKTPAFAIAHKKSNHRWMKKHPERKRANSLVWKALMRGKLRRLPCLVCGVEPAEGHHPDYSRPLDVVWLCNQHHRDAHVASVEEETQ